MKLGWLKPLARVAIRTNVGRRFLAFGAEVDPYPFMQVLARKLREHSSHFPDARFQFDRIRGFEDLVWLFTCNYMSRGIIAQDLDEAAYIYRLVCSLSSARCLEIGRYRGGSTFLVAAGLDEGSRLISIDKHVKLETVSEGPRLDEQLAEALHRFGMRERVDLVVADSVEVPSKPESFDLVLIDGDHSYLGVSSDYHHWKASVKIGGHLLFHDAACSRPYATGDPDGPVRLVKEIESRDLQFRKVAEVASLVHFVRTDVPFSRP